MDLSFLDALLSFSLVLSLECVASKSTTASSADIANDSQYTQWVRFCNKCCPKQL